MLYVAAILRDVPLILDPSIILRYITFLSIKEDSFQEEHDTLA